VPAGRQRDRHHAADLRRDGAALQGPVRPRAHARPRALGGPGHRHGGPGGHPDAGRAQPREDGRAPAPARHADVLPVRDHRRVLRAGRAPDGAQGQGVPQRHRHGGGRPLRGDLHPAPGGLRGPVARGGRAGPGRRRGL
ncbi:MAG: hypothetical protein AVDCRST_MAG13-723, partial [uncultured Solirubrobacteraceae bacterium]